MILTHPNLEESYNLLGKSLLKFIVIIEEKKYKSTLYILNLEEINILLKRSYKTKE